MTERREFPQYDISLDSQRFSTLIASGASEQTIEEQKQYIERQLKTDVGERIGVAESHFVYEIRGDKLFGPAEHEPFEDVIKKGVIRRDNGERETAELTCFQLTQNYLTDPSTADGTMVFNPSPPGSGYRENYLDIHRKVGNTVHSVRYLSTVNNEEYRQKILSISPSYQEVIPNNPTDLDFFLSPVVVPNWMNFNPDRLAQYILGEKNGISKEEYEEFWVTALAPQATSIINTLVNNPGALLDLDRKQNEFYRGAKFQIQYLDEKVSFGGGGCGSGACSTSSLSSESGGLKDKYGPMEFSCPSCGEKNIRQYDKLISNCQHCGSDKVLPKSVKIS